MRLFLSVTPLCSFADDAFTCFVITSAARDLLFARRAKIFARREEQSLASFAMTTNKAARRRS